jgi:uncharacterized protein YjiK
MELLKTRWQSPRLTAFVFGLLLTLPAAAQVIEVEPNDSSGTAQSVDGLYSLNFDGDVGDDTTNTSEIIPHLTVIADGGVPLSTDFFSFTVPGAGRGIFDIDYGYDRWSPDRFGIARQLDGTVWIKDDTTFYFLDENQRPQFGFVADLNGTIHNVLTVRPSTGEFYSINRGNTQLVRIDPGSGAGTNVGMTGIGGLTALAFDQSDRLFAVTGEDGLASILYELNPDTGAIIETIGDTETSYITGLDFHPGNGILYGHANRESGRFNNTLAADSSGDLYTVSLAFNNQGNIVASTLNRFDPITGDPERVGTIGPVEIVALAFNSSDELFATSGFRGGASTLYELDPSTGAIMSTIGNTGTFGMTGIDFQPGTDTLFGHANGPDDLELINGATADSAGTIYTFSQASSKFILYTLDTVTETVTAIGEVPIDRLAAIAFDSSDRLWAMSGRYDAPSTLYEIDPADGSVISEIGATGFQGVESMDFNPVDGMLFAHANAVLENELGNNLASDLNGNLYTMSRDGTLFDVDPVTFVITPIGNPGINGISALAFDATDRLFAMSGISQSDSILYEIDPVNGALLNEVGDTGVNAIHGMDFHPGNDTLYAHSNVERTDLSSVMASNSSGTMYSVELFRNRLHSFDPTSGLLTEVGQIPLEEITGLAFDGSDRLFAVAGEEAILYELDPANGGILATIGNTGFFNVRGLAFHPMTGTLFAHAHDPATLVTISTTDGSTSAVGASGLGGTVLDMGFDPVTEILYGINDSDDDIYTFDTMTGAGTRLGELGIWTDDSALESDGTKLYMQRWRYEIWTVDTVTGAGTFTGWARFAGQLYTVDKTTGVATQIATTDAPGTVPDLSFDPISMDLYGWTGLGLDLITIDTTTGSVTTLAQPDNGAAGAGLAFDRSNGDLFLKGREFFYSVDKVTGLATLDGVLTAQTPTLITVDTTTGVGTPIGPSMLPPFFAGAGEISDFEFDDDMVVQVRVHGWARPPVSIASKPVWHSTGQPSG